MKGRLFLDTNIVLDFFLERHPINKETEILFKMRENEEVDLFLSALTPAEYLDRV